MFKCWRSPKPVYSVAHYMRLEKERMKNDPLLADGDYDDYLDCLRNDPFAMKDVSVNYGNPLVIHETNDPQGKRRLKFKMRAKKRDLRNFWYNLSKDKDLLTFLEKANSVKENRKSSQPKVRA